MLANTVKGYIYKYLCTGHFIFIICFLIFIACINQIFVFRSREYKNNFRYQNINYPFSHLLCLHTKDPCVCVCVHVAIARFLSDYHVTLSHHRYHGYTGYFFTPLTSHFLPVPDQFYAIHSNVFCLKQSSFIQLPLKSSEIIYLVVLMRYYLSPVLEIYCFTPSSLSFQVVFLSTAFITENKSSKIVCNIVYYRKYTQLACMVCKLYIYNSLLHK